MDNNGIEITEELLKKARECKSAEGLAALAKENGREITGEKAKELYERLNPAGGKISDDELNNVTGGSGGCGDDEKHIEEVNGHCSKCGKLLEWIRESKTEGFFYCSDCRKTTKLMRF